MLAMFYLTTDRLLHILLNMRYPVHCTIPRTKRLLIVTSSISFLMSIYFILVGYYVSVELLQSKTGVIMYIYIPTVLCIIYILFAVSAYGVLFLKFARSRRNTHTSSNSHSLLYRFRHSNFYTSILLSSSFLISTVIPNVIYSCIYLTDTGISLSFHIYFRVSITLSDFTDSIVRSD